MRTETKPNFNENVLNSKPKQRSHKYVTKSECFCVLRMFCHSLVSSKLIIEQNSPAHQPNGQNSLKITSPVTSPEAIWAGGLVMHNFKLKTKESKYFDSKLIETHQFF